MNNLEQDISDMLTMLTYFSENSNELPAYLNIQFVGEILAFSERIKPLYVTALALRGDRKGEQ